MKRLFLFSGILVSVFFCLSYTTACSIVHGSGKMITEKRALSGFSGVAAGGAIELELSQADSYSVEVEADENVIGKVQTFVENGTLKIEMKETDLFENTKVHVKVTTPVINLIGIRGASRGNARDIKTEKLNIEVSGASKLVVTGTAKQVNSEVSGASKLDAKNLISEIASVECSGASTAKVHVNTSLKIDAAGASNVTYSGNPQITKETRGASNIAQE
ncbi:MAG: head GIN domain-containing protein [Ignavibacteriota bacterium]